MNSLKVIFLKFPVLALISHWVFQGFFNMGTTERLYKICVELLIFFPIVLILAFFSTNSIFFLIGFLIAHSLNFLFNGQLWVALRFFRINKIPASRFNDYVEAFTERARTQKAIIAVIGLGSHVRGEWNEFSDLDVRLLRKPGFLNGLLVCSFLAVERSRALIANFPLDAYVVDNVQTLSKIRSDEQVYDLLTKRTFSIFTHDK
jgi:L-malate glycosyltransferase